jgi:hypothetical protein
MLFGVFLCFELLIHVLHFEKERLNLLFVHERESCAQYN